MLRKGAQAAQQPRVRLDRLLSNLGYTTRQQAKYFIHKHHVTMHGSRVLSLKGKVVPSHLRIDGQPIDSKPLNLVVHKPTGYVCTREKGQESKIIYDMLPENFILRKPILSVAGRLDKWVTGLVLMSQNGELVKRIISPKRKTWAVHPYSGEEAQIFASGKLMLRGETKPCNPAKFEVLDNENKIAKITLYEGRYHQVRRMLAACGNKAIDIHRARVGPIQLNDLPIGKWRFKDMTDREVKDLLDGRGDKADSLFTGLDKLRAKRQVEGALERTKGAKEMGDEEGDEDDRVHAADEDAEAREYEKQSKRVGATEREDRVTDEDDEEDDAAENEEGEEEDEEGEEGEEEEGEEGDEEEDYEDGELTEADEERLLQFSENPQGFNAWGPRGKLPRPKNTKQPDVGAIDTELVIKPKYDVEQLRAQAAQREELEDARKAKESVATKEEIKEEVKEEKIKENVKEEKAAKAEKGKKEVKTAAEKKKEEKAALKAEKGKKEVASKIKTATERKREERLAKAALKAEKIKQEKKEAAEAKAAKKEAKKEAKSKKAEPTKVEAKKAEKKVETKTEKPTKESKKEATPTKTKGEANKENDRTKEVKPTKEVKEVKEVKPTKEIKEVKEERKEGTTKKRVKTLHEMAGEYDDGVDEATFRRQVEKMFGKAKPSPANSDFDFDKFNEEIDKDEYANEEQMANLREKLGLPRDLNLLQQQQTKKKKAPLSKKQRKIKNRK